MVILFPAASTPEAEAAKTMARGSTTPPATAEFGVAEVKVVVVPTLYRFCDTPVASAVVVTVAVTVVPEAGLTTKLSVILKEISAEASAVHGLASVTTTTAAAVEEAVGVHPEPVSPVTLARVTAVGPEAVK